LLITGGINGVFIFNFNYQGKYPPRLAAQVDMKGTYIKISLLNPQPVEKMLQWCKGLKVDAKSGLIISWNADKHQFVSFNTIGN
jgi:hypothetical protein